MTLRGCAVRSAERLRTVAWPPATPRPLLDDALFSALACNQFGIFSACDTKAIAVYGFALRWIPPQVRCDNVLLELVVG